MPRMGVIFDMDGVLIDSYQAHFESWRLLGLEIGRELTEQEFADSFGKTSREVIRGWQDPMARSEDDIRRLDDRKEELFRDIIAAEFPAMPGAANLIDSLHAAGVPLAVGSSGPAVNVNLIVDLLDRRSSFSAMITGNDVTCGKPDPQVFQLAAAAIGVEPGQCVVIEDAPVGIRAAHAAGMVCVGFTSRGRTAEELAAADLVVGALRELSVDRLSSLTAGVDSV